MLLKRPNFFGGEGEGDLKFRISFLRKFLLALTAAASGAILSSAYPPLNFSECAFFSFVPLLLILFRLTGSGGAFLYSFVFGWVWTFFAFNFLREIQGSHGVIPVLLATVLGCYFGAWGVLVRFAARYLRTGTEWRLLTFEERAANPPECGVWRELLFCTTASALFLMLEWGRAFALPWNTLAASQYQNLTLLQLGAFGGTYLIGFLIFFCNAAIASALDFAWRRLSAGLRPRPPYAAVAAAALVAAVVIFGAWRVRNFRVGESVTLRVGLVQPDISQRRSATLGEAREAMALNFSLGATLFGLAPPLDLIMMPESATPIPYGDGSSIARELRWRLYNFCTEADTPLLFGAVDVEFPRDQPPRTFNRAMLFVPGQPKFVHKFDKIKRVPFGEYVPLRDLLPEAVIRIIDMRRDLTAGTDFTPMPWGKGVRAGMNICYEDVFPFIARREALLGANLLAVISNDAWYPASSEPEQHFANCRLRTVETALPMIRCGNNSGSVVLDGAGRLTGGVLLGEDGLPDPVTRRRAAAVVEVTAPLRPRPTFFTRFGGFTEYVFLLVSLLGMLVAVGGWAEDRRLLAARAGEKLR